MQSLLFGILLSPSACTRPAGEIGETFQQQLVLARTKGGGIRFYAVSHPDIEANPLGRISRYLI